MTENWRDQREAENNPADGDIACANLAELAAASIESSRKLVTALEALDPIAASQVIREAAGHVFQISRSLRDADEKALARSVLDAFQPALDNVNARLRETLN